MEEVVYWLCGIDDGYVVRLLMFVVGIVDDYDCLIVVFDDICWVMELVDCIDDVNL